MTNHEGPEAIRNSTMLLTALVVVALSGCVSSQLATEELDAEAKLFTAPADLSYVYVIRRKAIRLNGVYLAVSVDQIVIGKLGNKSYLLAEVTPGHHEIEIRPDGTAQPINLELDTLPGRTYFIAGHMTMGPPDMKVVAEEEGKALLLDTRLKRAESLHFQLLANREAAKSHLAEREFSATIKSATLAISHLRPADTAVHDELYVIRATANAGLGELEAALSDYTTAIETGRNLSVRLDRALVYSRMGKDIRAAGDCEYVLKKSDPKAFVSDEFSERWFGGGEYTVNISDSWERENDARRKLAIDVLAEILRQHPGSQWALSALGGVAEEAKRYSPLIIQQWTDGQISGPMAKMWGLHLLERMGDPAAVPILMQISKSQDWTDRKDAASSLRTLGGPIAYDRLVELLDDENEFVRKEVRGLILFEGRAMLPALREKLDDPRFADILPPLIENIEKYR